MRIGNDKDQIGTWEAVASIINDLTGNDYGESTYRKKYTSFQKMLNANQNKFANTEAQLRELDIQKRELERAKIQFRDERNAWQRQNYIDARVEQKLDLLEDELKSQGRINFKPLDVQNRSINSNNDLLVILSDLHIGQCFDSHFGKYDSFIAQQRLNEYLNKIIEIKDRHNSENCYVSLQGDLLSGSIHKVLAITNRENVIEQIKIASELISSFCYELTKHFSHVELSNVSGNHSRIDRKEDALHDERLDDLIAWNVGCTLNHIPNFSINGNNIDNGICEINIRNKKYVSVHGDYDPYNRQGVSTLVTFLGYCPYAILYGHMHTCSVDETNGIKMIRGGSLSGSGDSYTVEKRLLGKPSQMVCVCTGYGVECYYPVELQ